MAMHVFEILNILIWEHILNKIRNDQLLVWWIWKEVSSKGSQFHSKNSKPNILIGE